MDIIIYGLCATTDYVEDRILKEHNVVGYTDSYAEISIYKGKPFYRLKDIDKVQFDCCVIVLENRKIAWQVRETLINEIGIDEQRVIPFFIYAESECFRIHMRECGYDTQGLILGNSHVFYGILTDYLSMPAMKLAASSQDIFQSYKTITSSIETYRDKLENLKWVLVDLYDYNELNYDLSLSSVMFSNLALGGVMEEHNFRANKMYSLPFAEEVFERTYLLADKSKVREVMSLLFGNKGNCVVDRREYARWTHIEKYEPIDSRKLFAGIVQKRYEDTITENKHIIKLMVEKIQELNPKIKIIFTLLPRYIMMERVSAPFMAEWKAEFEGFMHELMQEYGVLYWNYKGCEEISGNWRFWKDCSHLNTAGAICLTSILDRNLKGL